MSVLKEDSKTRKVVIISYRTIQVIDQIVSLVKDIKQTINPPKPKEKI